MYKLLLNNSSANISVVSYCNWDYLQLRLSDLHYMVRSALSGKGSLHPSWTSDATKRLTVLGATTFCLLMIRLQIMGSRLPVFTR